MMTRGLSDISLTLFLCLVALGLACYAIQGIRGKSLATGHFLVGCALCFVQLAMVHADIGAMYTEGYSFLETASERTNSDSANWFAATMYFVPLMNACLLFFLSAATGKPAQPIPRFIPASERLHWN